MEKSKKKEKKVKVISVLPYFFIGIFILLLLAGIDYICPEYLRENDEKNDLSNLMLAHSLIEFGRGASVLLVIVLPALMNIATYIICGFWISILFQIVLYYAVTDRVY